MIRTAFYVAVFAWLTRLFVRICYRIGYALGYALTRIVLALVAGAKVLLRSLHALAVREVVRAPAERRETPPEQRTEFLRNHADEMNGMVPLDRAVVPGKARHHADWLIIHPPRKRR